MKKIGLNYFLFIILLLVLYLFKIYFQYLKFNILKNIDLYLCQKDINFKTHFRFTVNQL